MIEEACAEMGSSRGGPTVFGLQVVDYRQVIHCVCQWVLSEGIETLIATCTVTFSARRLNKIAHLSTKSRLPKLIDVDDSSSLVSGGEGRAFWYI